MLPDTAFDDTVRDQANQLTEQDRYGEAADLVRSAVRVKAGLSARSESEGSFMETVYGTSIDEVGAEDGYAPLDDDRLDGYLKEAKGLYDGLDVDGATALEDLYTHHTPEEDDRDIDNLILDEGYDDVAVRGHFHDTLGGMDHLYAGVDHEPVQVLGVTDEQRFEAWTQLFDSMTDA